MTKKHYEAIADCIDYRLCSKHNHPHFIAYRLAQYFKSDNPAFNESKFYKACNIPDYKIKEIKH